jgi:hypothetical protein
MGPCAVSISAMPFTTLATSKGYGFPEAARERYLRSHSLTFLSKQACSGGANAAASTCDKYDPVSAHRRNLRVV